jgi:TonB family protein
MKSFESEELTDQELNQMLAAWTITVPSDELRGRIFQYREIEIAPKWGAYARSQSRFFAAALAFQACAVALLTVTVGASSIQRIIRHSDIIFLASYRPKLPTAAQQGGGGGGHPSPTAAAHGEAPKFAHKPFIPPTVTLPKPALPVVPTISATAPQIEASNYGDPMSKLTGTSLGQGANGFGIGSGNGDGYGPGYGGSSDDGIFKIGGDVSAPVLISKFEPEYSDEARRAKISGSVLLSVVIDEHGIPRNFHVIRPLGLGLDQKAIEAVQRWRFRPGLKNGHPVPVEAQVMVSFQLL